MFLGILQIALRSFPRVFLIHEQRFNLRHLRLHVHCVMSKQQKIQTATVLQPPWRHYDYTGAVAIALIQQRAKPFERRR